MTLNVAQDISTLNMSYIADSTINNNILVAQNAAAVRGLAELAGHSATRPISASGSIRLTFLPNLALTTPSLIFDNTTFRCTNNNLTYSLRNPNSTISTNTDAESIVINVIEGEWQTQKFVARGAEIEIIHLDDLKPIDNSNIIVYVNSELYRQYLSINEMGVNTKGYKLRNGISNQVDIVFGDGIHGVKLNAGDTVLVQYLTTNGELGNIESVSDAARFEVLSGVYDSQGNSIDISDSVNITYDSGFALGSYGEHIETTRNLAGYQSRSSVFARAENLKAYLSRLSILSHIDVWTEEDDFVFNAIALPNISNKISSYSDYLYLNETDLRLTDNQISEIKNYINASGGQLTSSEIVFHQPVFEKYAIFVYLDASYSDVFLFKQKVYNEISKLMLNETFADVDMQYDKIISKSAIVKAVYDLPEVTRVSISILSERNEAAKIQGYYEVSELVTNGSAKEYKTVTKTVLPGDDPNIGFSDLGDIVTSERFHIPIIRGGFQKYDDDVIILDKPIYIFKMTGNTWHEI
jgi:hypothetical protein